ncbi:Glyoxylate/hydroxypyruvate reductase B [Thalictrum thalictroides]|uniref:Glyoxylate/hydroxypyruvate reductase B n=1 Tax=Thalictrum thalictroides TaxID=46969 RepID=A0A7J6V7L8_THATH|nr:Glyoxylate/hydroxypyruvate reductase B [Thalictrum thalictroides]
MADEKLIDHHTEQADLPVVLVLGSHPCPLPTYLPKVVQKFNILSPYDSPTTPIHEFLITHAQEIRVLLCLRGGIAISINQEILNCLPSLECIVNVGTGVNHIDLTACKHKGIVVTNAGTVFSDDVADYAVALLLDVLRSISASNRYVRSGLWPIQGEYSLGHKVGGKRVGIIGLGSIGSEVAKRLQAFGCSIAYNSRKKKESVSFPYYSNVTDLAANSDALILCCALTEETHHIINKDVLSALGKEGVVINIGRGALIDEKELVRCLVQGEIGGAGLDVFENEPNVPKELFELDNVVMTPHSAVRTPESFSALHELTVANLEAFFSNKPLLSPVNYE